MVSRKSLSLALKRMNVPKILRGLKDRNKWSHRELAEALGVGERSIYRWCYGECEPSPENRVRIYSLYKKGKMNGSGS